MKVEKKTETVKKTKTIEVQEDVEVFVLKLSREDVERLAGLFDLPTWSKQPAELAKWLEDNHRALRGAIDKWWVSSLAVGFKWHDDAEDDYDEDETYDEEDYEDDACFCGNPDCRLVF